jgi:hypothetical protein
MLCRGALDPKAHYKKLDSTKFPKYFQMGTVVEGPTDYYSGALGRGCEGRVGGTRVYAVGCGSPVCARGGF